jgi:hypothetical protein
MNRVLPFVLISVALSVLATVVVATIRSRIERSIEGGRKETVS